MNTLQNSFDKNLSSCKIKVIFKSTTCLSNFFRFKDKVRFNLRSNVVYKFLCGKDNVTYYGKACQHFNIRAGEHSGVLPLSGKKSNAKTTTAVKDHVLFCDHVFSVEDFKILGRKFHLKMKESLLISRDKSELSRNEKSFSLYLFD